MNNRIKELADQCNWQEVVVEDGEEWIHAHFDKQKFAELIVRECANRATWAQDTGEKDIGGEVLKYFGVEE